MLPVAAGAATGAGQAAHLPLRLATLKCSSGSQLEQANQPSSSCPPATASSSSAKVAAPSRRGLYTLQQPCQVGHDGALMTHFKGSRQHS